MTYAERKARNIAIWENWDWSLTNRELANRHKLQPNSVRAIRIKLGKPKVRDNRYHANIFKRSRARWAKWDWSKQDIELADEHGCTRERVRQIRSILGVGPSPKHRKHRRAAIVAQKLQKIESEIPFLSAIEIAERIEVPVSTIFGRNLPYDKWKTHRRYPWLLMNWRLPDTVIARVWGMPFTTYPARKRQEIGLPRSPYNLRKKEVRSSSELLSEIQEEIRIRQEWENNGQPVTGDLCDFRRLTEQKVVLKQESEDVKSEGN